MNGENIVNQMMKISKSLLKARDHLGKTVRYYRTDVIDEGGNILKKDNFAKLITFGVKNTNQISRDLVDNLIKRGYLFNSIDMMSEGGRAIDIDRINPLTGRTMSGSSSGSCINILLGINDFAIGTDGGGSVLAPAISTGLYSIMGKGIGLKGDRKKLSTDQILFSPGIGIISYDYNLCMDAIEALTNIKIMEEEELKRYGIKVAVPKGVSENKDIKKSMEILKGIVQFVQVDFDNMNHRPYLIDRCKNIFEDGIDIILTEEGPIDLCGVGDSILGSWGDAGESIQNISGKHLLKVVNMIDGTGITIPTGELGKGILIIAKKGINHGNIAISLGKILESYFPLPDLFKNYFINGYRREKGEFI